MDNPPPAATIEPTTHCPACGSPSFWLAGESWRCAYCNPWPELFTGISLVLDAGRWSDGALRSQGTSDRGLIRRG